MDPIQSVHVKLLACDFCSLTVRSSNPPSFSRKGRPVSRAETLGVVVSRERKEKFLKFLVDDGTGCTPCILWLNQRGESAPRFLAGRNPSDVDLMADIAGGYAEMVRLGSLVRVRGRITAYRGVLQITVGDVVVERDPNSEMLHWLDCVRLARYCYDLPPPPPPPPPPPYDASGRKGKGVLL